MTDDRNPSEVGGAASTPDREPIDLDRLDHERRIRGWTKVALAKKMGVSPETVSDIYRRAAASPDTYRKLVDALEANPASGLARELSA